MWVRWLATVRSPRNSAGGDLAVRPSLGDECGDPPLGCGQPLLARAPADAPELGARPLGPAGRAELLEAVAAPR